MTAPVTLTTHTLTIGHITAAAYHLHPHDLDGELVLTGKPDHIELLALVEALHHLPTSTRGVLVRVRDTTLYAVVTGARRATWPLTRLAHHARAQLDHLHADLELSTSANSVTAESLARAAYARVTSRALPAPAEKPALDELAALHLARVQPLALPLEALVDRAVTDIRELTRDEVRVALERVRAWSRTATGAVIAAALNDEPLPRPRSGLPALATWCETPVSSAAGHAG